MNQIQVIVRQIEKRDNQDLALMIRAVFEEYNAPRKGTVFSDPTTDNLFELFQTPSSVLWIAEHKGVPVGCCGIFPTEGLDKNCAELVKLYLTKEHRGSGMGKKLFEKSIQSAKYLGYQQIYLESFPLFIEAIDMYEKYGFARLAEPLGNTGHSACNVWMLKQLN